jgi:hypothetical protein
MRKALEIGNLLAHTPTLTTTEWDQAMQFVAVGAPIREAINDVGAVFFIDKHLF